MNQTTASARSRTRVLLLFGGRSGEHSISCATAAGVIRAMDPDRYDIVPVGVTANGRWVAMDADPDQLDIRGQHLAQVPADGDQVLLPADATSRELRVVGSDGRVNSLGPIDVVFPLLHGPYGEDGTVQGALELLDLPYVGAGVLASALGMDKHFMKIVFEAESLPVAPYEVITAGSWLRAGDEAAQAGERLGYPLFVKPARAGSSLGISRVDRPADLATAIVAAQKEDAKVLLEAAMSGREIEVAVLQGRHGEPTRATAPGEIIVTSADHAFYDFETKYLDQSAVRLDCPADLPEAVITDAQELAVRAFDALGCEGLARVDFFYSADGGLVINEINTMPGFTPFSMYPMLWQATGLTYPQLIDELIALALERPVGLR